MRYEQRPLGYKALKKQAKAKLDAEKEKVREEQRKKDEAAEKQKALEEQRKKDRAREIERERREKAREKSPAKLPDGFGGIQARTIIESIDFNDAEYVETITSDTGKVTRRAFVHYSGSIEYDVDDTVYYKCWVGANAHPNVDGVSWDPGHSYILEFKDWSMLTSAANALVIGALPASRGVKPDVL